MQKLIIDHWFSLDWLKTRHCFQRSHILEHDLNEQRRIRRRRKRRFGAIEFDQVFTQNRFGGMQPFDVWRSTKSQRGKRCARSQLWVWCCHSQLWVCGGRSQFWAYCGRSQMQVSCGRSQLCARCRRSQLLVSGALTFADARGANTQNGAPPPPPPLPTHRARYPLPLPSIWSWYIIICLSNSMTYLLVRLSTGYI